MSKLYSLSEDILRDIGDSIREKRNVDYEITPREMPDEIRAISGGGGDVEPITIHDDGVYESDNGYSPVTVDVVRFPVADTIHTVDGIWHCPDDWDDVEQIELPSDENSQVLYLTYRTDLPLSFISCGITSGAYKYRYGHVVDGEFVPTTNWANKNSGAYIQELLQNDYSVSQKNTIVVHIEPTNATTKLTGVRMTNWAAQNIQEGGFNSCVVRYGQLPYATSISCSFRYLEVDNIRNCRSLTSCSGYYNNSRNLQKFRHDGWNTSNVTTFANMFQYCTVLSDIDMDFTGFVTSKCTTMQTMFQECKALKGTLNVTGWDTSNVTNVSSIFMNCINIKNIIGIEDWNLSKCTNFGGTNSIFVECRSLCQTHKNGVLDLSNWKVGTATTSDISLATLFSYLTNIKKIVIQGWDLSNVTAANDLFRYCCSLEEIVIKNIVPPNTGKLTSIGNMMTNCSSLKSVETDNGLFDGWDLSNTTNITSLFQYCYQLRSIEMGTPTKKAGAKLTTNVINSQFGQVAQLNKVDMSWIDLDKSTSYGTAFQYAPYVTEFYPPSNIALNFDVSILNSLDHDSLVRVLNALKTVTTTRTLTLKSYLKSKLSIEEIAIATGKGWTIA